MEQEVPADASSLIYLAKADAFEDASHVVRAILVPTSVWREAVAEGERIGAAEVPRIHVAADGGFLRRVELTESQDRLAGTIAAENRLGAGESEVLVLAARRKRAIVDEGRASRVARARGITPISTLFLPVVGRIAGDLDLEHAIDFLDRLAAVIGVRSDVAHEIEQRLRRGAT